MSLNEKMTALADAIRDKAKLSDPLSIDGMTAAVEGIEDLGNPLESVTVLNAAMGGYIEGDSDGNFIHDFSLTASLGAETGRAIVDADTVVTLRTPIDNFGTAARADVAAGKTFTSAAGLAVTGTLERLSRVSGTTRSGTIETGLSSISLLVLYRETSAAEGLIQALYDGTNYFGTCADGTVITGACGTVSGGTFSWTAPGSGALAADTAYNYIAYGLE